MFTIGAAYINLPTNFHANYNCRSLSQRVFLQQFIRLSCVALLTRRYLKMAAADDPGFIKCLREKHSSLFVLITQNGIDGFFDKLLARFKRFTSSVQSKSAKLAIIGKDRFVSSCLLSFVYVFAPNADDCQPFILFVVAPSSSMIVKCLSLLDLNYSTFFDDPFWRSMEPMELNECESNKVAPRILNYLSTVKSNASTYTNSRCAVAVSMQRILVPFVSDRLGGGESSSIDIPSTSQCRGGSHPFSSSPPNTTSTMPKEMNVGHRESPLGSMNSQYRCELPFSKRTQSKIIIRQSMSYDDFSFLVPNEIRIPRESVNKQELIVADNFGEVYKAFYQNPHVVLTVVAVKTLHLGAQNVRAFVEEGIRMEVFKHRNVLSLVGISFNELNCPIIITPFMAHGDLLSYVRNESNVDPDINCATVVVVGCGHRRRTQLFASVEIHPSRFGRKKLPANKIQLLKLNEEYRVKVTDFGLSRDVYKTELYTSIGPNAIVPLKWLPPENVERREFTPKSDIWSYGVTLWELLTRGSEPYAGMTGFQTLEFPRSDRRLEKLAYCPDEMYKLMELCRLRPPHDRPDCIDICVRLPSIIRMLESNGPDYVLQHDCTNISVCQFNQ